jgi:hypothetical protein
LTTLRFTAVRPLSSSTAICDRRRCTSIPT